MATVTSTTGAPPLRRRLAFLLLSATTLLPLLLLSSCSADEASSTAGTCSLSEHRDARMDGGFLNDPNLRTMEYDVGEGPLKTMVYVEPNVTSFYKLAPNGPPAKTKVTPKFNGLSGKFINLSKRPVSFYWEATKGGTKHIMRHLNPFGVAGTATFPGHYFVFTEQDKPDDVIIRFTIKPYPNNIYWYDPYYVEDDPEQTERNLKVLTASERKRYDQWRKTLSYNEQYKTRTGRSYLANYLRKPPIHYIWPTDYFGQEHWIVTKETHFVKLPPKPDLKEIPLVGTNRKLSDGAPRHLQEYRDPSSPTMNMTLKVMSCAPRVLEIPNFLSEVEVQHILELAGEYDLKTSTVGDTSEKGEKKLEDQKNTKVRTSRNSWVRREKTAIVDAIYRRAADLMRIDEAMFRFRTGDELPELSFKKSMAEQLQLVHYDVGQEYTAHHDFGYVTEVDEQDARFATLLLYLNEVPKGGETSFPRWSNAETFKELKVAPDTPGKAVLFYSQLPDGNLDDFSQHAALPVIEGEKWLINLWVHDPVYSK